MSARPYVNWSNVNGATGYLLDVSTSNAVHHLRPGYQNLKVGNTTSYNLTGFGLRLTITECEPTMRRGQVPIPTSKVYRRLSSEIRRRARDLFDCDLKKFRARPGFHFAARATRDFLEFCTAEDSARYSRMRALFAYFSIPATCSAWSCSP